MYMRGLIAGILVVALGGCEFDGGDQLTAPVDRLTLREMAVGGVVQHAGGGAHWTVPASFFGFEVENVLTFNAKKFANGSVGGRIEYHQSFLGNDIRLNARVTCIEIYDGNRVKYGGVVEVSNQPDIVPGELFIWFQGIDNGEGGEPDLSTIAGAGDDAANEAFCASPAPPVNVFPIQGNIQVRG